MVFEVRNLDFCDLMWMWIVDSEYPYVAGKMPNTDFFSTHTYKGVWIAKSEFSFVFMLQLK
jgi:hypothetical protein